MNFNNKLIVVKVKQFLYRLQQEFLWQLYDCWQW